MAVCYLNILCAVLISHKCKLFNIKKIIVCCCVSATIGGKAVHIYLENAL